MATNEQNEFEYEIKEDEFQIEELHNLEPKTAAKLLDEIGNSGTEEFYKYKRPVLQSMRLDINALDSSKGEATETLHAINIISEVDSKVQAILLGEEIDSQVKLPPEMGEEVVVDPITGQPMKVEGFEQEKPKSKSKPKSETEKEKDKDKDTKKTNSKNSKKETKTKEKEEKDEGIEIGE